MDIVFIILFFIVYLIFFQIKSLRDYIMEYEAGKPYRWNDSICKKYSPMWLEGYLIDDSNMFINNNPPAWIVSIVWDVYKGKLRASVDGWHQLDGLSFLIPYWYILIILNYYVFHLSIFWISLVLILSPFVIWYPYFNYVFHVLHRKEKEVDRSCLYKIFNYIKKYLT